MFRTCLTTFYFTSVVFLSGCAAMNTGGSSDLQLTVDVKHADRIYMDPQLEKILSPSITTFSDSFR